MPSLDIFPVLALAMLLDAVLGDPRWFYRFVPHPARLMGMVVSVLDAGLNRPALGGWGLRAAGATAVVAIIALSAAVGVWITEVLTGVLYGPMWMALFISTLISQNSLFGHVSEVHRALETDGLEAGRAAVAHVVGRDPASLDQPGVARAAIESLAENYADGVVAPVFWAALFGLPGIMAYKALNTADSMIGHRNERYRHFGWAAARLDDLANFVPARLAGAIIAVAAVSRCRAGAAVRSLLRDATKHRSVNAGYPEAAMAGALGLRLAGLRVYGGTATPDAWMGDGEANAGPADIQGALKLYVQSCLLLALPVFILAAFRI